MQGDVKLSGRNTRNAWTRPFFFYRQNNAMAILCAAKGGIPLTYRLMYGVLQRKQV